MFSFTFKLLLFTGYFCIKRATIATAVAKANDANIYVCPSTVKQYGWALPVGRKNAVFFMDI